ncbi:MAG: thioesterase-like [Pseudonocardiales bacterium]|nr:thioesterase-like [Pseudonocardiales bacterium]
MSESAPGRVAPLASGTGVVLPEWIDENDHMNLAFYVMLFDVASVDAFRSVGMGEDYQQRTGFGQFAVESHVLYQNELLLGDEVQMGTWVLGGDTKRIHLAHAMHRVDDGTPVATQELMFLNVSLTSRRVTPWPEGVHARITEVVSGHAQLPRPAWAGRHIAMPS